jgi:hypothetical protein
MVTESVYTIMLVALIYTTAAGAAEELRLDSRR